MINDNSAVLHAMLELKFAARLSLLACSFDIFVVHSELFSSFYGLSVSMPKKRSFTKSESPEGSAQKSASGSSAPSSPRSTASAETEETLKKELIRLQAKMAEIRRTKNKRKKFQSLTTDDLERMIEEAVKKESKKQKQADDAHLSAETEQAEPSRRFQKRQEDVYPYCSYCRIRADTNETCWKLKKRGL